MAASDDSSDRFFVSYLRESSRPLVSLVFIAPMLVVYEGGMLVLGPEALRNGADVWLRQLLRGIGFGQYFLLPLLTCGLLLAWHYTVRQPWRFRFRVLYGMLLESAALGLLLLVIAHLNDAIFRNAILQKAAAGLSCDTAATPQAGHLVGSVIGFFGAGIYEELLFRLILLSAAVLILRAAGAKRRASLIAAVIVISLIFSAAHYRLFTAGGDVFELRTFAFRALAGVFFSVLFLLRGFGITASSHALYNIFTLFPYS